MSEIRFMREPEILKITGLSRATIVRLEKEGRFPLRRKISRQCVGWLSSEVDQWMTDLPDAQPNEEPEVDLVAEDIKADNAERYAAIKHFERN